MWDKIKQHPWVIAAVIGVFVLVLFLSSSSSSTGTTADTTGTTSNGDQIAAYMASLNQQGQIASLAAGVQNQQTAAGVTVAQLQAGTADNANTLAAQVAEFQTSVAGQTQQNADTLSAQTAQSQIQAGVTNTSTVANALVQEQQINAGVQTHSLDTIAQIFQGQQNVQTQQIAANQNIQTQSWVSKIFG